MSYWVFRFYDMQDKLHFEAPLVVKKCAAIMTNGNPCKNITSRVQPYCKTCMKELLHLKIAKSTILKAGYGLFAFDPDAEDGEIIFEKEHFIAPYMGEYIDDKELDKRYINGTAYREDIPSVNAPYALTYEDGFLDSALNRGVASYANHAEGTEANSYLTTYPIAGIKACRNIIQNEEIFCDYGDSYWGCFHCNYETIKIDNPTQSGS